jgi:hypothetical protein
MEDATRVTAETTSQTAEDLRTVKATKQIVTIWGGKVTYSFSIVLLGVLLSGVCNSVRD